MNIYVGNLAYSVTDAQLKSAFEPYGEVVSAEVIIDKRTRRSRGYGFVRMAGDEQGQAAIGALNGKELQGRPLRVDESKPDNEKRHRAGNHRSNGAGSRSAPRTTGSQPTAAAPRRPGLLGFIKGMFSRA